MAIETLDPVAISMDERAQARVQMDLAAISDYALAFQGHGPESIPPVKVYRDPEGALYLADGFHRVRAAIQAATSIRADVEPGTLRDAIRFAAGANTQHGVRRTAADKRRAVRMLLADELWATRSDRWIADTARVSPTFAGQVRAELGGGPDVRVGQDGKTYPAARAPDPDPHLPLEGAATTGQRQSVSHKEPQISSPPETEAQRGLAAEKPETPPGLPEGGKLRDNAGTPEWVVRAVRSVLGVIELDPFSRAAFNATVGARRYFNAHQDGFRQEWVNEDGTPARVFQNPPFSCGGDAMAKALVEYKARRAVEICSLVMAQTGKNWFRNLWDFPIAFLPRLTFVEPPEVEAGTWVGARENHVIVYMGPNATLFTHIFSQIEGCQVVLPSSDAFGNLISRAADGG